jgi:HEPN domain-containing protein
MLSKQEKFEYWLDCAQYDLDSADILFKGSRWLSTAFSCQQAIEKLIKGLYILYIDDNVPLLHNIKELISRFEDQLSESVSENYSSFFSELSNYYIKTRYTSYKKKMSTQLNSEKTEEILNKTKEVFAWLLTLKK